MNLYNNNSEIINDRKGINKNSKETRNILSLNALKEENAKKLLKKKNIKAEKQREENYGHPNIQTLANNVQTLANNRNGLSKKYL